MHPYSVKRGKNSYSYNKLSAQQNIFNSAEGHTNVRVIHLSRSDDPRNLEARKGIERRNYLNWIRTLLNVAERAVAQANEYTQKINWKI